MSTTEAVGTATKLAESKKRGASSPPNLDTRKKQLKKKKADRPEEEWTVVNNRKERKQRQQQQQQNQQPQQQQNQNQMQKKKPKVVKPEAIVLKPADGKTYADILSTIRTVKPEDSGIEVRSIRQIREGQVLLVLKGSTTTSRASFSDPLKVATGDDCTVEELVPRVALEIRDLDNCTSEDEVKQALKRVLQDYNGILRFSLTQLNTSE